MEIELGPMEKWVWEEGHVNRERERVEKKNENEMSLEKY